MLTRLQVAARRIKHDVMTVYFVARDPRNPVFVRVLALSVAAYALSPIDLIPDFIPVLGYLDDIVLLPLGILLVLKLTPPVVVEEGRARAAEHAERPTSHAAAAVIVAVWGICAVGLGYALVRAFGV